MSAKNVHHDAVIAALKADGWTSTHDPLRLRVGKRDLYVDLAAERPVIGAEKGSEKSAVEVQSFLGPSDVAELEQALGQFALYRAVLARQHPDRLLYLGGDSRRLRWDTVGAVRAVGGHGPEGPNPRVRSGPAEGASMDKLSRYREIIRGVIDEYASWGTGSDHVQDEVISDPVRDHYELKAVGWEGHRRVHHSVLHLDIINGKIWIQYDGTNRPVAEALVAAGVPKEDIVLAEKPADLRPFTGYGVG